MASVGGKYIGIAVKNPDPTVTEPILLAEVLAYRSVRKDRIDSNVSTIECEGCVNLVESSMLMVANNAFMKSTTALDTVNNTNKWKISFLEDLFVYSVTVVGDAADYTFS